MPPQSSETYRNPDFRSSVLYYSEDVTRLTSRIIQHASTAQLELHCLIRGEAIPDAFRGHMKSVADILGGVDPIRGDIPLFLGQILTRQTGKRYERADEEFKQDYTDAVARLSGVETFGICNTDTKTHELVAKFLDDLARAALAVPRDHKRYTA